MEGARMQQACAALCECMTELGVGIDGGKDSLTMSTQVRIILLCRVYVIYVCA